jgi:hypothetical protein
VQCIQLRGVFDVPEVGDGESNDDMEANDVSNKKPQLVLSLLKLLIMIDIVGMTLKLRLFQ